MELDQFLDQYEVALQQGDAAVFVGAGLSRPSGYVDWRGLLRDLADELGLDIDREQDLIAVAQFHVNHSGSRARLDQAIMTEFTRDAQPSPAHELLARLPVKTLWTTNYDRLIESAFRDAGKRLDVKSVARSIAVTRPRRDAVLYKMHGDVEDPGSAVLTKEDYETYSRTREAFSTALQADLLTKTFLFLGFSFTDPNLDYVLARIRGLLGEHQRPHYCFMRPPTGVADNAEDRAEVEYQRRRFDLRVADLQRYSIRTVLLDDYDQIPRALRELDRRVRTRSVFVSGSAGEYGAFGEDRLHELLRLLGRRLVTRNMRVVSGLGRGVGGSVVLGALEHLYDPQVDDIGATDDLLAIRPFPLGVQDAQERRRLYEEHRRRLLAESGIAVFVMGNRLLDGVLVDSPGVLDEFRIALESNVLPIPVGATGYASRALWERVSADPQSYFGDANVSDALTTLGDAHASTEALLDAIFAIIDATD